MSDNLRGYRAIHQAVTQWYQGELMATLAGFVSCIVGLKRSQLPSIAAKVFDQVKAESHIKRLSRWLANDNRLEEVDGFWLPDGVFYMAFDVMYMPLATMPESPGQAL
jgi:hypothetical protein